MNIESQIREIAKLQPGWHNGTGVSFNLERLLWLSNLFLVNPLNLKQPSVCPHVNEEIICIEWNTKELPSLDINLINKMAYFDAFQNGEPDQTYQEEFNLNTDEGINKMWETIGKYVSKR